MSWAQHCYNVNMMDFLKILYRDACGRCVYQIAGSRQSPVVDVEDFIDGYPRERVVSLVPGKQHEDGQPARSLVPA